jgi:hypothetical protein
MIELATKAFDAAMRRLIIWCRNEWQKEVKRAQEDPDNQQLMRQIQQEEKIKKDKRELIVAGVVEDPMDIIDIPIAHGKRTRKPVQWYCDINWDDNGKAILDEDVNEGSKQQHQCPSPTISRLPGTESIAQLLPHPETRLTSKIRAKKRPARRAVESAIHLHSLAQPLLVEAY